ncbi:MAG: outer membrane lipoprotein-sorting protein [Pseudomonadales bacterium]|nr:outer membrane lipoprotein-sorting protein [Pseudomonadales bacterium]
MNIKTTRLVSTLAAAVASVMLVSAAQAKVPQEQAKKLGGSELTVTGAEVAGNADGTILAYDGGMKSAPACYKGGEFLCNPFPDDKPLFTITAENVDQYKDKLSPGQYAMFQKYPETFRMPVYQSRRTFRMPEHIAELTKKNALSTEPVGPTGLKNYELQGYPFPIPNNGLEAVWNHIARWRGDALDRYAGQVTPLANGAYSMVMFRDQVVVANKLTDYEPGKDDNVLFYGKQVVTAPSRLAGNVLLVHETLDQVKEPRRAWIYNAGQRRVRRAPQVAYDGPGTAADGMRTADNYDLYNGSPDRYEWTLKGKREMYIGYNSYKLDEKGLPYDDVIKPGHINQDLTRYELHRVWEVEANLRSGTRHIYAKRVFFLDEDSWMAAVIDHYDGRGNLWRVAESHEILYYHVPVQGYSLEVLYDLHAGRYLALGFENNEIMGVDWNAKFSYGDFQPAALRRAGVR